jgi:hypothetical protein
MITLRRRPVNIKAFRFNGFNYKFMMAWLTENSKEPFTLNYSINDRSVKLHINGRDISMREGHTLVYEKDSFLSYSEEDLKNNFVKI